MSTAEELLRGLNDSDLAREVSDEEHVVVGADGYLIVPSSLKKLGVQNDHNMNTVRFDCLRYWDGRDLMQTRMFINYMRSDGKVGMYMVEDMVVDEADNNIIHFSWSVSDNATAAAGTVTVILCAKKSNSSGYMINHWHSELNTDFYVSTGLGKADEILSTQPDVIGTILARQETIESALLMLDANVQEIEGGYRVTWFQGGNQTSTFDIFHGAPGVVGPRGPVGDIDIKYEEDSETLLIGAKEGSDESVYDDDYIFVLDKKVDELIGSIDILENEIDSSHTVNVTDIGTFYPSADALPTPPSQGNGARYVVSNNGELPLYIYSYSADEKAWTRSYRVRGSTLYLDLATNRLYRFTMATPYFVQLTMSPEEYESLKTKVDDVSDKHSNLESNVSTLGNKVSTLEGKPEPEYEDWEFTLSDGTKITKKVHVQ